jgi:Kef-type K+ transport system membrane component KefB
MKYFRPCIVAVLVLGVTAGFFLGKVGAEMFGAFATGLIVYWFKSRDRKLEDG